MKIFDEILGNELIIEQLKTAIRKKNLKNAYLISGEKGIGKKTLVEAFLLQLFCENRDASDSPCRTCPSCKKIISGNHPDVIFVNHEKPNTYGVEDIRTQITGTVDIRPYAGGYKVYIIPEAEKMTVQAENALLKTLEEPPEYVILFLLADDDRNLLDTVKSRVIRENMRPLTDSQVREYLEREYNARGEKAEISVAFSRGVLGRAIELCGSEEFYEWYHRVMKILRGIRDMSVTDIRIEIGKLQEECPDLTEAVDLIELWYRDLLMFMVTRDLNRLVFKGERAAIMKAARETSYNTIEKVNERIETCRERLSARVNPELSMELLLLSMRENR